jgi:hypothetical protein
LSAISRFDTSLGQSTNNNRAPVRQKLQTISASTSV